jgi:hypothetical protein
MLLDLTLFGARSYTAQSLHAIGQVAQLVERGPEKAGVGGSIPSLATILFNNLASLKTRVRISRAYNTRTSTSLFSLLASLVRLTFKFPNPCCWLLQCAAVPACHLLFLL